MADTETMDETKVLILKVTKNPVLFDKVEKAYKEKDMWKEIRQKVVLTIM